MNTSRESRPTASGLWVGDTLPPIAELCLRSHVANGIDFQLFTYQSYGNVPEGVRVRDANEILPTECIFTHNSGSMAPFSDWFRYTWMSREGGFWCDLDVISLTKNVPQVFPWFAEESEGVIAIGAFGFPAGHPLTEDLRRLGEDPAAFMPWDSDEELERKRHFCESIPDVADRRREERWGATGPPAFSRGLIHYGLADQAASCESIYPIHYTRWKNYYDGSLSLNQFDPELTWGLHVWAEMLRKEPCMLDRLHPESVISQLMERYGMMPSRKSSIERRKVPILVGICSAQGYYERRKTVRDTWFKHPQEGVECLFFLGGDVPEREKKDTIGLDTNDSYHCLPEKVLAFFKYALEHYEFDWLFKCDEDTYLDLSRLPELVDTHYGIIGDISLEKRHSPSGGAGYFLSREIVEKIVARKDVPLCGAEDIIFGKLALEEGAVPFATPRLFMSNTKYLSAHNDMVSVHWCNSELMRMMEVYRHETPDAIYRGTHQYWKDDLLFYKEGIFRRLSTDCYGWWSQGVDGILTLRWKTWGEEQLIKNGNKFSGSMLEIEPCETSPKPIEDIIIDPFEGKAAEIVKEGSKAFEHSRIERLHLGCGNRNLTGWINLDLPRYDITQALPWRDGSVWAYYLEYVIECISPEALFRFLREVWRTLRSDGVLRIAFTDRERHADGVRMNYAPFRQQQTGVDGGPGWELEALIGHDGVRSFWTLASMSCLLRLAGFDVTIHEPGQSATPDLKGLERVEAPEENPFLLLGTVCVEARKPEGSPLLPCSLIKKQKIGTRMKTGETKKSPCSHGVRAETEEYVSPFFCSGSRTGNRLFQIAAVYAHSLRHGLECRVPWRIEAESTRLYELLGKDSLVCPDGGYTGPIVYNEPHFSYDLIPSEITRGRLNGYFQSEKYFDDYAQEIRALYARLTIPRLEGEAGVHVRMGDYLEKSHQFRSPDGDFLQEALSRLSHHIKVLHVFSDSGNRALQLLRSVPAARRFELVLNEEDTLGALTRMSGMHELVMSCSSYSWWAAYLGQPDQVIVQKDWFASVISDYQDVYRSQWIKL